MKVIGVSGMPGSGKSLISNIARKKGFFIIRMGDMIRKEAERRNEDSGKVAIDLRKESGDYVVANLCVEEVKKELKNKNNLFLIEGIRSPYEVELFKENFLGFKLLSVFSPPKSRFARVRNRKRLDDSSKFEDFEKRDKREIEFGIAEAIMLSDYLIINEGHINSYKREIYRFLNRELDKN
ncbi:MAG: nucleoside monophosphate kinase [Methanobacteriaceae archaeon]